MRVRDTRRTPTAYSPNEEQTRASSERDIAEGEKRVVQSLDVHNFG
jgi:hypothetical protein